MNNNRPLDANESKPMEGGPSFSISHRMFRLIWGISWTLLASWTPVPFHGWRRFILRLYGAKLDSTAKVYPSVSVWYPPNLTMGKYTVLGPKVQCYCMDKILMEDYVIVSQGSYLCGGTHDVDDLNFQLITKPIIIKERAWVAADAFIAPGVTIGKGAVIGARSAVFKDVDPLSVVGGNPAKFLRKREIDTDIS